MADTREAIGRNVRNVAHRRVRYLLRSRRLRWFSLALAGVLAAPFLLIAIYALVPPVSTLMVANWLAGKNVKRQWIDLDEVSPALPIAVIAAEDAHFCAHSGVDWDALRNVIESAGEDGPIRGASTITMQTVKNLFLWPEPAYLRKAIEIPLALVLDAAWSKRRIMEVYLNIAEWGPSVFGAEAAARYHFRKSASRLSEGEAALLVAALPNPFDRNAGRPGPATRRIATRVAARARTAGDLIGCLEL